MCIRDRAPGALGAFRSAVGHFAPCFSGSLVCGSPRPFYPEKHGARCGGPNPNRPWAAHPRTRIEVHQGTQMGWSLIRKIPRETRAKMAEGGWSAEDWFPWGTRVRDFFDKKSGYGTFSKQVFWHFWRTAAKRHGRICPVKQGLSDANTQPASSQSQKKAYARQTISLAQD